MCANAPERLVEAAVMEPLERAVVVSAADAAGRRIPPAWPLAATVAVNPFLGQTYESLAQAGARLARISAAAVTMPRRWYREKIAAGVIAPEDLAAAFNAASHNLHSPKFETLEAALAEEEPHPTPLPTVADLAAGASGTDWPGIVAERIGAWAGSYFDEGQALWRGAQGASAFGAWRAYATHDLTPEILGLKGFANDVDGMPVTAREAILVLAKRLGLGRAALESYFHQLLLGLAGWSQYARFRLWQAEMGGRSDETLIDLLAVRLAWEAALFRRYAPQIAEKWNSVALAHAAPAEASPRFVVNGILQEAYERAAQRHLAATLAAPSQCHKPTSPLLQAVFCIDVRSEVFRRALESVNPQVQTLGFAGFFGMAVAHRRIASDVEEARLPVLLQPAQFTCTSAPRNSQDDQPLRLKLRAKRAWSRFKLAAVSSFAFVEAAGPVYAGKLLVDSLGLRDRAIANDPAPRHRQPAERAARALAAENVLRAMSFTTGFARLVLLVGHGAHVVNNPHASALQCGACGGYSGDVNARLLASLLNDADVRHDLAKSGIAIPGDTLFVGALHDTTTDRVMLYRDDCATSAHEADLRNAALWLEKSGEIARGERAVRLPATARASRIGHRGRDWAEIRPEWGLAGCRAFIAAPRSRTIGKRLDGRVFLHDYDWKLDKQFAILELILTAPVVVASWISLQYYGSTVSPDVFGAGNKILHNVVGGLGVMEGNGGPLRTGLPWQSVHDGTRLMHEPLRLTVCVEAPRDAISQVLRRHPAVSALFDNGWMHLIALDDSGRMEWRYRAGGDWVRK